MKSRCLAVVLGLLVFSTGMCNAQEMASNDGEALKVHLQDDGSLAGRLRVFYATGKSEPAEAKISFLQDGNLLDAVETDDMGHFQLAALEPGEYVAKAAISTGTTDFTVNVVEFEEGADPDSMFLDASLTPIPDGQIIEGEIIAGDCGSCGEIVSDGYVDSGYVEGGYIEEGIIGGEIIDGGCGCGEVINEGIVYEEPFVDAGYVEEYVDPGYVDMGYVDAGCCGGGFTSSGCCGGGGGGAIGGGGRLLGLAALGTAIALPLALNDDTPVSPARP